MSVPLDRYEMKVRYRTILIFEVIFLCQKSTESFYLFFIQEYEKLLWLTNLKNFLEIFYLQFRNNLKTNNLLMVVFICLWTRVSYSQKIKCGHSNLYTVLCILPYENSDKRNCLNRPNIKDTLALHPKQRCANILKVPRAKSLFSEVKSQSGFK